MVDRIDQTLARAIAAGVLPASAIRADDDSRPWPVVLLTALGAWLAAVPLLGVVGLLLGDLISSGAGPYIVGLLVLVAAVVLLRASTVPLFVEQLAVPALLVGGGSLAFGIFRDLPERSGALVMAGLALAVALAVPRPWLRVLLGVVVAGGVGFAALGPDSFFFGQHRLDAAWLAWHGLLAVWLLALALQRGALQQGQRARHAATLESLAAGWLLVVLAGMAWLAGMTFLVGGVLGGGFVGEVAREVAVAQTSDLATRWLLPAASALLGALAAANAARAWPPLRQPAWWGAALVAIGLAWLMPTLGAVLLALSVSATTQRWRLAAVAAVAFAWIVGAFYYALAWPLATKAAWLAGAGALLAALAWGLMRSVRSEPSARPTEPRWGRAEAGIAAATLATLAVAGGSIWQKEDLIAHGQALFVALAPVDPRSLMQGDYMRLAFRLPDGVAKLAPPGVASQRPFAVARRDANGVAALLRTVDAGAALAPGELLIELTPRAGGWAMVSDAWSFREGEAERWAVARYGEFRVAADGRALLVGLADADLKRIVP